MIYQQRILLTFFILGIILFPSSFQTIGATPSDLVILDYDPLVDIQVTVEILKIRAFDKQDPQVRAVEYVDEDSDPDFYLTIKINNQTMTSPPWHDTKYIYNPNISATVNVPDDQEYVTITIQLWDWNTDGSILCDIGNHTDDVTLTYSIKTGQWTGDDHLSDSSGYGRLNGCDDGIIYNGRRDAELWFTISQNDEDNDSVPYWMEVNTYGTNPLVNNTNDDTDHDNIPFTWEWRWGYNPIIAENHHSLDPDHDSLTNIEEYQTSSWFSDPYRKDLFMELDQMQPSPQGQQSILPTGSKEILNTAYDRQNIVYHLDDGTWNNTGSDIIPFDESTDSDERSALYEDYFLHGDENNWRRGVFHYGIVLFQDAEVNGCAFGANRFQISSNGMEEKATLPWLDQDTVYASAYMHETGHTLGIWPIPGHNKRSGYPWRLGWWLTRSYKSCMNYGYMYYTVDYSDGSRLIRDYNDWERMDLTAFESDW